MSVISSAIRRCTALVIASLLFGPATPALAAELDVHTIPRVPGATDVHAFPGTILYTSPTSVDDTGKAIYDLLTAGGWQRFEAPPYEAQGAGEYTQYDMKKGPHAISVYVMMAPAKGNATSVQYGVYPDTENLPVPADATEIAYSIRAPHLECLSKQTPEALLDFYRKELTALGWARFTAPKPDVAQKTSNSIRTHFIKENKDPLLFILDPEQRPGHTIVYLKSASHDEMMAEYAPKPKPAAAPEQQAAAPAADDDDDDDSDAKFDSMVKDLINEALKPSKKDKPAEASLSNAPLTVSDAVAMPVPIPDLSSEIEHQATKGTLEFKSQATVAALAEFYKSQMKSIGFKEKSSVINSKTMKVLNFSRGKRDEMTFTLMQMGKRTNVSARGDILKTETVKVEKSVAAAPTELPPMDEQSATTQSAEPEQTAPQLTEKDFEMIDKNGLPVPNPASSSGTMKSKFQFGVMAGVEASVDTVVALYRAELLKRGWSETATAAAITAQKAQLHFETKDGPAVLKINKPGPYTNIELFVRQKDKAIASGLMPKPGQVKVMFGNILEGPGEITIASKTFKVKAGERAEDPNGPSIELPPGKHTFTVKSKGQPAQDDTIEAGADEIWGVLIGPGGGLPLQMY